MEESEQRAIWLVRHCKPEAPLAKTCLGRKGDLPLSAEGRAQAKALAERMKPVRYGALYCSPLARSIQTAAFLGEPIVLPGLTELDMGKWDGLDWETIKRDYPDLYEKRAADKSIMPPGAEGCQAAALRYAEALRSTKGDCVVVGHRGAMGSFLCQLLGLPYARAWDLGLEHGCMVRIDVDVRNGVFRLASEHESQLLSHASQAREVI